MTFLIWSTTGVRNNQKNPGWFRISIGERICGEREGGLTICEVLLDAWGSFCLGELYRGARVFMQ